MEKNKMIKIPFKMVLLSTLGYLILPIILFLVGWIKFYFAFPAATLLFVGTVVFYRNQMADNGDKYIEIELKWVILSVITLLLCVWMADVGGFSVSNFDSPWREAFFNDLVNYTWPIEYPATGYRLVYYITFWMLPAFIGKFLGVFWGNIFLLIWEFIGIYLTFLLIYYYLGSEKNLIKCILFLLIFFSGIKYLGMAYVQITNLWEVDFDLFQSRFAWLDGLYDKCDGHAFGWYYRFNYDAICQVYNQTPIVWLCTALALINKYKIENYIYIGIICFAYAPVAFLGLFALLFLMGIFLGPISVNSFKSKLKRIVSVQNICVCLSVFLPFSLYYFTNSNANGNSGSGIMLLPFELFGSEEIVALIICYLVEFGIYALIIFHEQKRNPLYYIALFILILAPFIEFGHIGSREVNMNATIPAMFIIMIMILQFINNNVINCTISRRAVVLITCLILASLTPVGHIILKIDRMVEQGNVIVPNSWVETYADKVCGSRTKMAYINALTVNDKTLWSYVQKDKSKKDKESDALEYKKYKQDSSNEIVEGKYYITPKNNDSLTFELKNDGVYQSEKRIPYMVYIMHGQSIIKLDGKNIALDVPSGKVDQSGYLWGYEVNEFSSQRFNILKDDTYYMITYGKYHVCFEEGRIFLKKATDIVAEEDLWKFTPVSEK